LQCATQGRHAPFAWVKQHLAQDSKVSMRFALGPFAEQHLV